MLVLLYYLEGFLHEMLLSYVKHTQGPDVCLSYPCVCFQCLKPHLLKHINALERVQRHFTKRITVLSHLPYEERLPCLELDTLECLRLKTDLTLYYKTVHNLTPWPIDRYLNMCVHSRHTRLTECSVEMIFTFQRFSVVQ